LYPELLWGLENREQSWLREPGNTTIQGLGGRQPLAVVMKKRRV
jgi:hypothetical protein